MKFDLKTVVLEGVDCSGKTTAFSKIHKMTGFKWNIHDRSTLSMLCYALMYNRDVDHWRELLNEELDDLNNAIVVLIPGIEVIKARLISRGDEFQNVESIVKLNRIFENEVSGIAKRPNVLVCRQETPDYEEIVKWLFDYERQSYSRLSSVMLNACRQKATTEINFLKVTWTDTNFNTIQTKALHYEPEIQYYDQTRSSLIKKIRDERLGQNIYGKPQHHESRRYILAQETCISYLHFIYRNNVLYANIVCRSSEMSKIFPNDIHFLGHLGQIARQEIGLSESTPVKFCLTLDSAHVMFENAN